MGSINVSPQDSRRDNTIAVFGCENHWESSVALNSKSLAGRLDINHYPRGDYRHPEICWWYRRVCSRRRSPLFCLLPARGGYFLCQCLLLLFGINNGWSMVQTIAYSRTCCVDQSASCLLHQGCTFGGFSARSSRFHEHIADKNIHLAYSKNSGRGLKNKLLKY